MTGSRSYRTSTRHIPANATVWCISTGRTDAPAAAQITIRHLPVPGCCGAPPGGRFPEVGHPIDLASGIELITTTDIAINGSRGDISIARTYRTLSSAPGPFGIGTNHNYGYLLNTNNLGGTVISLIMPDGNQLPFTRQADGTLINSTIPMLRGVVLTTPSSDRADLRWKDGTTFRFTPRDIGFRASTLEAIIDANGNTISLVRNPSRPIQITEVVDPVGRRLRLSYDPADRITSIVDPIGRTVQYTYNAQGTLAAVTDSAGGVTAYTYDSQNNQLLTSVTDPRGMVVAQNIYDANGRVVQQIQADGGVIDLAYTF